MASPHPGRAVGLRRPLIGLLVAVAAATLLPAASSVGAAAAWWQLVAFSGQPVTRVVLVSGHLVAVVGGVAMEQTTGGFVATAAPAASSPRVSVGSVTWSISPQGDVMVSRHHAAPVRDPGSPGLGAGADLIAAPLAVPPGVQPGSLVVAVSSSGLVWRRAANGSWGVSLVMLPDTLVTGTPAVTSLVAFNASGQSGVVYLGTDGFGTLLSDDGGDDWTRANPGLPDDVTSLASDPSGHGAIWAGTTQGLYVHRLQPLPEIPSYSGGSLTGKWLATIALGLVVALLAGTALIVWERRAGLPAATGS